MGSVTAEGFLSTLTAPMRSLDVRALGDYLIFLWIVLWTAFLLFELGTGGDASLLSHD